MPHGIQKIVSGGQTGADRAALDVALEMGFSYGGWVPKGRLAEDGEIPRKYAELTECDAVEYASRTELNVRDSDATLIVSRGPLTGGSLLTYELAERYGRPIYHADLNDGSMDVTVTSVVEWASDCGCRTLNVAGPRASGDPEIYSLTKKLVSRLLGSNP